MATFKVKTFNELSGKGQDGDIAIIERADINGNQGFSFRNASGWSLPFVQVQTLGANLMTTNTSQSISAAKTFQGEVVVNDDFSVIGATDIDLGFVGNFTIDAGNEANSKVTVDNVEDIELSADAEILISAVSSVALNANDTLGNFTKVELLTTDLNLESNSALLIQAQDTVDINSLGDITMSVIDKFKINGLQSFADNAAALLGGLTTDMIYKTATGELRIVV